MGKSIGIKPTGKKLTNLRSKITELFSSNDREMNKLGQLLCHQYRINYWVLAVWDIRSRGHVRYKVTSYHLVNVNKGRTFRFGTTYHIKFKK